jgi:hypothetical protein
MQPNTLSVRHLLNLPTFRYSIIPCSSLRRNNNRDLAALAARLQQRIRLRSLLQREAGASPVYRDGSPSGRARSTSSSMRQMLVTQDP